MEKPAEIKDFRKLHYLPGVPLYYQDSIELTKAQGARVWDSEGREYLDSIGGIVTISVGHNHPRIKAALKSMIDQDELQHTSSIFLSRYPTQFSKNVLSRVSDHLSRIHLLNSGSEANELALLAARTHTKESMVVHLRHSYHGATLGALSVCGHSNWKFSNQPTSNVTAAVEPYCYRCPFGKTRNSCSLECAKNVEETILTTTHGKIAAFIAEPILGVGGFIDPPKEYFHEVYGIVKKYGGLTICDEVQTGAYRCGKNMYYSQDLGLKPDILTSAKGVGNGAPIALTLMRDEIAQSMTGKVFFNTFGGDPYQTRQANEVLNIIDDEHIPNHVSEISKMVKDGLEDLKKRHMLIGDVRGQGLLLGLELVKDRESKAFGTEETAMVMEAAKNRGLLLGRGGLRSNVLRVAPPLIISKTEVSELLTKLDQAFTDVSVKLK